MSGNPLKNNYDKVENLGDLIRAREDRDSAFSQTIDSTEDIDVEALPDDPSAELTYPHHHGPSKDHIEGMDIDLMSTPHERDVAFDWQDSAEEQLPTDPDASEGMGDDDAIDVLFAVDPNDPVGPVPLIYFSPELSMDTTEEEEENA